MDNPIKKVLCLLALHKWEMEKEFLWWRCSRCGKKKEEAPWH